jgi:hypothetical protein
MIRLFIYFDYLQVMIIKDSVSSSAYIQSQMMELRSYRGKWWWRFLRYYPSYCLKEVHEILQSGELHLGRDVGPRFSE